MLAVALRTPCICSYGAGAEAGALVEGADTRAQCGGRAPCCRRWSRASPGLAGLCCALLLLGDTRQRTVLMASAAPDSGAPATSSFYL
jgi:hypothetical protein